MIKTELKRGDGLRSGRIWLESVVRNMQIALVDAGYLKSADGKFGSGTEKQLKRFQSASGVTTNPGVADRRTWKALQKNLAATVLKTESRYQEYLQSFRGDLAWVHAREGHRGRPYWPGGSSGVTLDPGVDLGHISFDRFELLYAGILNQREINLLRWVSGIKGRDARAALNTLNQIKDIRVSTDQANTVFPYAAQPYWDRVCDRMPGLRRRETPASVQTVLLSLAYNRGAFNRGLEPLEALVKDKNWPDLAATIKKMQQGHKLEGIRIRRRQEGQLVLAELDFLDS